MGPLLSLILISLSVGASNFGGAIAFGIAQPSRATKMKVGLAFGLFEGLMPVLGLLVGESVSGALGHYSRYVGGALLVATGLYTIVEALGAEAEEVALGALSWRRLLVTAVALSIDNLAAGFVLGVRHINLLLAAVMMSATSVVLSFAGLELGEELGERLSSRGELLGGGILVVVGAGIALGLLG